MRLINTTTLKLTDQLTDEQVPPYAILSHCWGAKEVSLQEFIASSAEDKTETKFEKIQECCELARQRGLGHAWVDTCCIDKTSSAELSEAINSMFEWYRNAACCFVTLSDVGENGDISNCGWFKRGWTLQELLAPKECYFYDFELNFLGTREELKEVIAKTTGIPVHIFTDGGTVMEDLEDVSVAQIMSWASGRETTRVEDMAYCLLGLFNVNMPLMYGERERAFVRLQQQIIARSYDESIFAWEAPDIDEDDALEPETPMVGNNKMQFRKRRKGMEFGMGLLARSPKDFKHAQHISRVQCGPPRPPYKIANHGLEIRRYPLSLWNALLDGEPTIRFEKFTGRLQVRVPLGLHCQIANPGEKIEGVVVWLERLEDSTWCRADRALQTRQDVPGYFESLLLRFLSIILIANLNIRLEMAMVSLHETPNFQHTQFRRMNRLGKFCLEWVLASLIGGLIFMLGFSICGILHSVGLGPMRYVILFGTLFSLRVRRVHYNKQWLFRRMGWISYGLTGLCWMDLGRDIMGYHTALYVRLATYLGLLVLTTMMIFNQKDF